jgi:hypothetical protein
VQCSLGDSDIHARAPPGHSPAEFKRCIAGQTERWKRVIGETGVKLA